MANATKCNALLRSTIFLALKQQQTKTNEMKKENGRKRKVIVLDLVLLKTYAAMQCVRAYLCIVNVRQAIQITKHGDTR